MANDEDVWHAPEVQPVATIRSDKL